MNKVDTDLLVEKYRKGTCNAHEREIVERYILFHGITPLKEGELEQMAGEVSQRLKSIPTSRIRLWPRYIGAAAATLALIFGLWWFTKEPDYFNSDLTHHILPGKNRATLTLPNSVKIPLDETRSTIVINMDQLKYEDGSILGGTASGIGEYVLATPKGGQYRIVLPDESIVWLNAASTLRFQRDMNAHTFREVNLEGEAYFEIAKNRAHPFKVHTNNQVVEVLGTHFNVSAYTEDRMTKTVLIEGSVKVNGSFILRPGQQSTLQNQGITVAEVNTYYGIAWKNGEFAFRNEALNDIMTKLERWYNVDVQYANPTLAHKRFGGTISKYEKIQEVLKILELTDQVRFKIEGRRSTVMP